MCDCKHFVLLKYSEVVSVILIFSIPFRGDHCFIIYRNNFFFVEQTHRTLGTNILTHFLCHIQTSMSTETHLSCQPLQYGLVCRKLL